VAPLRATTARIEDAIAGLGPDLPTQHGDAPASEAPAHVEIGF
jgi:hypothetical protein